MRRSPIVFCAIAVVLGVILGSCSREPPPYQPPRKAEPIETASSPSPNPTPEASMACKLLSNKDRRSIAGRSISIVASSPVAKGSEQCRWVSTLKSGAPTTVQVALAPAQVWAKSVPQQAQGALRLVSTDKKMVRRLLDAKKKVGHGAEKLSDKEACGMFALLAEANGRKKDVTESISFPPFGTQISAQARTCTKGIYATVTYSEIGLKPSSALGQAVLRLLRIAVKRAEKLDYAN